MESLVNTKELAEVFKNAEINYTFNNGQFIMKLAGENVWCLINRNGDTCVRTNQNGENEFSRVDFYDMDGEPYMVEFSEFNEGFMVVGFNCNKDGKETENFYEVSPFGFTQKCPAGKYQMTDVERRSGKWFSAEDFLSKPISSFESKQQLDFLFDVAKGHLMNSYKEDCQNGKAIEIEEKYFLIAEKMTKKHTEVLSYFENAKTVAAKQGTSDEVPPQSGK